MYLTGFADEAAQSLNDQIRATQALSWNAISTRSIDGKNIHELSDDEFEAAVDTLGEAGIRVPEFGSLIGNWGKPISSDFDVTLAEIDRAIPRMQRLGTKMIRVMSYAQEPWGEAQHEAERFKRLRVIHQRFADAGLDALHENCMNWGGFSSGHSLRLVEEVPGLKLIFDTGNPIFQRDRSKPEPHPFQNAFEFCKDIREHIAHVHIKDCRYPAEGETEPEYTMPGEGDAELLRILTDLKESGYDGGFSIEPHVATVFHAKNQDEVDWEQCFNSYVAYGQAFGNLLNGIGWEPSLCR